MAKKLPIDKLSYGSANFRHRLGQKDNNGDGVWFDYENENLEVVIRKISELLDKEMDLFFSSY